MQQSRLKRSARLVLIGLPVLLVLGTAAAAAIPGAHRMVAPGWFGMREIAPSVYLPEGVDAATMQPMLNDLAAARRSIERAHRVDLGRPAIFLCPRKSCDAALGEQGARGIAHGSYALRLEEEGLNRAIAAHEMSHIALKRRVGDLRTFLGAIPAWFDEGLAVLLSGDPRFDREFPSSAARYMRKTGSFREWGRHMEAIGWMNAYGGSRDLVAAIHDEIGMDGIIAVMDRVAAGEAFETALNAEGVD